MTRSFDNLIRIAVRDLHEFDRFLMARLTKFSGVALIESSILIRRVNS